MNSILDFLGAREFMAHSMCLTNDPVMIALYTLHDGLIWLSYMVIAFVNWRTKGVLSGPGYAGFSLFILLCGLTHWTDIIVLKWGVYRLDLVIRIMCAWVSAMVAAYVLRGYLRWRST